MKQVTHICVVDDLEPKREDLLRAVRGLFPEVADTETYTFGCVSDVLWFACRERLAEIRVHPEEWLMVIDMRMPLSCGAVIESHGGYDILSEFSHSDLKCPVIVASSEPVDETSVREEYRGIIGVVRYQMWPSSEEAFRKILMKAGYLCPGDLIIAEAG